MTTNLLDDAALDGLTFMQRINLAQLILDETNHLLDEGLPVPHSLAFSRTGDVIDVYGRDALETELSTGGTLLYEAVITNP